jgi:hypothetical protein
MFWPWNTTKSPIIAVYGGEGHTAQGDDIVVCTSEMHTTKCSLSDSHVPCQREDTRHILKIFAMFNILAHGKLSLTVSSSADDQVTFFAVPTQKTHSNAFAVF